MVPVRPEPTNNQVSEKFQAKLEQIKRNPHQLRRTIAYWPYYETLQKILDLAQLQNQQSSST
jgi:hypothetical protein